MRTYLEETDATRDQYSDMTARLQWDDEFEQIFVTDVAAVSSGGVC
jgi:hypothetical protein